MNFTIAELKKYSAVKNLSQLEKQSKKDSKLKAIFKDVQEKIKTRKNVKYFNQKTQTFILNKVFTVTSTKFTATKSFADSFEMIASEVKKLQDEKLNYEQFKNLFAFVSKFILCNYSIKNNLAKHERFYSQCLAQVNFILNKFTADVIHSRSKKIEVKKITLANVEKKFIEFNSILFNTKAKSKTAKLIKTKVKSKKEKISV